ncbi:SDR family NAD(P)-dependent oxidoreductase [Paenactinomyces guangxiensis]|uniref:SDR family NAD(P)-dependent oxidoreductase n=1 Tax=Paenactinomyces guangxiensis TaxID=1490290 RepID=A0A7W1WQA9_9BACL|nr:SDR family NAD(P)-dependent oxidoreductase [Paenactinomyces guangxiensis]MBA4493964.1 SDR family NAD(P)-dependent oxidoreductase [Paenactinomyces guangxiensis]MBH8591431.1 SDR family NAD(P)-dependent oxidoreductase [Paenactinomyces guangxiensis]
MRLKDKIAVVTGSSRGAGRGIALALGQEGAVVYVTGRSTRAGTRTENRPETIEETAELVTSRGGTGIPVRVDHTVDEEVRALFERIQNEQGHLDLVVNNAWGGNELPIVSAPFWELSMDHWRNMFTAGVRSHIVTSKYAAPLMISQKQGLIIHTSFYDNGKYNGHLFYDLAKNAMNRLAFSMAKDLRSHNVAVIALSPGWMRTERVMESMGRDEKALQITESTEYIGRAVCAVASDPRHMDLSGTIQLVGDLAKKYDFTDTDGRYIPPFRIPNEG